MLNTPKTLQYQVIGICMLTPSPTRIVQDHPNAQFTRNWMILGLPLAQSQIHSHKRPPSHLTHRFGIELEPTAFQQITSTYPTAVRPPMVIAAQVMQKNEIHVF